METYDKQYFIKKFEAIPDEEIGKTNLDAHCALWHCGVIISEKGEYVPTEESIELVMLFGGIYAAGADRQPYFDHYAHVTRVNDGYYDEKGTPKSRILAKLHSL